MNLTELIRTYCLQNASEANVIKYSYYFKSGYDAYGLSQPTMEAGAKDMLKWKNTAPRLIIQYATEKMTLEQKLKYKKEKNHAK